MTTTATEKVCCKTTGTARSCGNTRGGTDGRGTKKTDGRNKRYNSGMMCIEMNDVNHGLALWRLFQTFLWVCACFFIGLFNTGKILLL